ncbi:MAG: PD40 domain-containing protein, partial [Armatimonadetes bacterium]|nr:PD40 domain-containing protein [Armatimonadota bacterium]
MADDAERRLAAIMFTDMVGYSSLVEENEARALSLLNEHNKLLKAVVERHHGSLIKTIGDAFFVEFRSAFDACTCALAMQMRVADRNQGEPPSRQFQIRIGIHVGDVVVQDGDLFGDGVNVAARIESLAEPGGIALSEDAARQVDGKLPQQLQDLGPQSLKNLSNRVRIYRMVMPGERAAQRMYKRASHLRRGHGPLGWLLKSSPVLLIPLVQLVWPRLQEDVSARGLSSAMAWQAGSGTTVPGRGLIAFSSNRSGDFDLYVLELGGGLAQQVTSGAGEDLRPAWNRTAGKLVFQRTIRGNSDVRLVDINSHQERALTNRPGYDGEPCFTPDGRAVLYVSEAGGSRRLYRQAIDGGKAEALEFAGQAVASPTSSVWANKVAWVAVKNGQRGVFVAPANALQQAQRLPLSLGKGEVRLTWRNTDGALLVFSGRTTRAWIDGKVADSHGLPRGEQFSWSPREAFVFCAPGQKGRDDLFVQT